MDGHFVPNITIGPPVIKCLEKVTDLPFDAHLMIEEPDRYIQTSWKPEPIEYLSMLKTIPTSIVR